MIWLMLRGDLPGRGQGELLDAALMSAVDHGPQAPSIAIARMAATCGVGLNNAMASAVNVLGDVHGGAGEQAVELYQEVARRIDGGQAQEEAVKAALAEYRDHHGKFVRWWTRPQAKAWSRAALPASRARWRPNWARVAASPFP
jgi:citrate synthase